MKIWQIYCHSDFTWNQFFGSGSSKTAILTKLEALNFEFDDFLQFLRWEFYQNQKSKASKTAKMADFEPLDSPKLISRKIWVAVNLSNFHTVKCQLVSIFWAASGFIIITSSYVLWFSQQKISLFMIRAQSSLYYSILKSCP